MSERVVGIDLGAQKTVVVADDAELVLTTTGGISRPTLVSHVGKTRLHGEEAASAPVDSTISPSFLILGKSLQEVESFPGQRHRKKTFQVDEGGNLKVENDVNGNSEAVFVTSIAGMFFAKLYERITEVHGANCRISFVMPPGFSPRTARAVRDACTIAGIDDSLVTMVDAVDCLVSTYGRKFSGLRPPEKAALEGKNVVLIEMGHCQSKVVVIKVKDAGDESQHLKLASAWDEALGSYFFDLCLFDHFQGICKTKYGCDVEPGSRRGTRLLSGCERIRKLLSQLPESSITVENLTDAGDISFTLRRDELGSLCQPLLQRFKDLIHKALSDAGLEPGSIFAVEVLGGGVRMQVVQSAIFDIFGQGTALGAKFDDASIAVGAALAAISLTKSQQAGASDDSQSGSETTSDESVVGLSAEELARCRASEVQLQAQDLEIKVLLSARNALEAFILDSRAHPRRKHGQSIDAAALGQVLDEAENWMWDNPECSLSDIKTKADQVKTLVDTLCAAYFEATEKEKRDLEIALDQEAAQAMAERAAAGEAGDEDDHDTRKLKKADRMRLVVKNKEEGTELFKGGVWRTAAARYHKALSHCAKFFDLSPEDEAEVKALKVTLYLNLATCYLKLGTIEQVLNNCNFALELDPKHPKAFFRRSQAYEAKKDWTKALEDAKTAQVNLDTNDPGVSAAVARCKAQIAKEAQKEKAMWGKAFSSN